MELHMETRSWSENCQDFISGTILSNTDFHKLWTTIEKGKPRVISVNRCDAAGGGRGRAGSWGICLDSLCGSPGICTLSKGKPGHRTSQGGGQRRPGSSQMTGWSQMPPNRNSHKEKYRISVRNLRLLILWKSRGELFFPFWDALLHWMGSLFLLFLNKTVLQ